MKTKLKFKKILTGTLGLVIGASFVSLWSCGADNNNNPSPLQSIAIHNVNSTKILAFEKYNSLNFSVTYNKNDSAISHNNLQLALKVVDSVYDHDELLKCLDVVVESQRDNGVSAYVQIVDVSLPSLDSNMSGSVIEILAYDRFFPEQQISQTFKLGVLNPYFEVPRTDEWFNIERIEDKNVLLGWASGVTIETINAEGYNTLHIPSNVDIIANYAFYVSEVKFDTTITRLIVDGNDCELGNFCFGSFEFDVLDLSSVTQIGQGIMVRMTAPTTVMSSSANENALQSNTNSNLIEIETDYDDYKVLHLGKKLRHMSSEFNIDVGLLLAIEPIITNYGAFPSFILEAYSVDSFSIDSANTKYKVFKTYGLFGEIIGKTLLEMEGNNIKYNLEYDGHKVIVPAGGTLMMGCVNVADWFFKKPHKSVYVPTLGNNSILALNFGENIGEILPSNTDVFLDFDSATGAIRVIANEQWQLRGAIGPAFANKFLMASNLSHQEFLYCCMNNGLLSSIQTSDVKVESIYSYTKYEQPLVPVLNALANEYVDAVISEAMTYYSDNGYNFAAFPSFFNGYGKYYGRTSIGISQATIKSLQIGNVIDLDNSIHS